MRMRAKQHLADLTAVAALVLGLISCVPLVSAQDMTDEERFLGDYELVSYYTFPEQGPAVNRHYVGRLSYDEFGNMAGLGMPIDLPERAENAAEPVTGGFAYWGKVTIDSENKIVTHHVEGSPMVPRWVGGDNVRYYEFEGDLLKLSLKNSAGRITATLTWRRLQ